MYKIYKYTFPNGKIYIGKTKNTIEERAGSCGSRYGTNTLVGRAIRKYGWINIKKEIILDDLSEHEANLKEREFIKEYGTTNREIGYNLTRGGDGGAVVGRKLSEEEKRKIGERAKLALSGRKVPKDRVERMRNSLLGHEVTSETREKIRQANLGKKHSEETKKKLSDINKNRSSEISKKISESLKKSGKIRAEKRKKTMRERYPDGFKFTEEQKKKISEKLKGVPKSEETKQKMRKPKSKEAIANMTLAQRRRREAEKFDISYKENMTRITQ